MEALERPTENLPTLPGLDSEEDLSHLIMDSYHFMYEDNNMDQMTRFSNPKVFNAIEIVKKALLKSFFDRKRPDVLYHAN